MELTALLETDADRRQNVQQYYGQVLGGTRDLKTKACCTDDAVPNWQKPILAQLPDEVLTRFYGCGSPIPPALEGCTVLDLGCGTGRDAFLVSKLVGPHGQVIGVDMTAAQLDVARRHEAELARRFGYDQPNTRFHLGFIEDLKALGLADASVDVVISNCVINLASDKRAVFTEIFRVLREGGELYFSDVFADRRLSPDVANDPLLHAECLGGAMYEEDFRRMLLALGVPDYRVVSSRAIEIDDPALVEKVGPVKFFSKTLRAFKLAALEDRCEDFGQVTFYRGGVMEMPHAFTLDDHHVFERNRPMLVCGNTAAMVQETRFGRFFDVLGDRTTHFGLFDCAPATSATSDTAGGCGC